MKESDVVGDGPSRSKCAQILAMKGLDVVLLEKLGHYKHRRNIDICKKAGANSKNSS